MSDYFDHLFYLNVADRSNDSNKQTNTRSMASSAGKTLLNFNEARDDGVTVASAEAYANHLHLTPDK